MITPAQIRAARAFLAWKQTDLAERAGISEMSVKNIERGHNDPRLSTLTAIKEALEAGGVRFVDGGVMPLLVQGATGKREDHQPAAG